MSSPKASSSTPRPSRAGNTPNPNSASARPSASSSSSARPDNQNQNQNQAGEGAAPAPKAKSAKDLKKEKRAAAVAARGPSANTDASNSRQPTTPQTHGQDDAPETGSSGPGSASRRPPLSTQPSSAVPAQSSTNVPRRPPILSSESSAPFTPAQQNLFFSHLPAYRAPSTPAAFGTVKLHPLIIRLGVLMSSGRLRGSNARTIGTMSCFQEVIRDYESPEHAVLWKDLPVYLSPMIAWLETCRPKGVGGGNAIRWLKSEINRLGERDAGTEAEQKEYLIDAIGNYLRDRIEVADQVIADNAKEKIRAGDTVVTYARSSVVEGVLLEAWREMRELDPEASFDVIIVDSRPLNEGKSLLQTLSAASIPCTYILLPLLSSVLPRATLILLGGSALHSDGALYARAGTALVAMLAKEHRVPVVACVETYKFGERVTLDGVASNELGDGEVIFDIPVNKSLSIASKPDGKDKEGIRANLTPLSLLYDLTPPSLITAVCTEIGFIPPSSVPTVLGKANGVA